jgi:hypothetical protein
MKTLRTVVWLFVFVLGLGVGIFSLSQSAIGQSDQCPKVKEADDKDDDEALSAKDRKKVKITMEQAKEIALKRVAGTIIEAGLEKEHGRIQYAIDVCDGSGKVWDVEIDAVTGDVLQAAEDDKDDTDTALAPPRRRESWSITL